MKCGADCDHCRESEDPPFMTCTIEFLFVSVGDSCMYDDCEVKS